MADRKPDEKWHVRLVHPGLLGMQHLPWLNRPIRPADIGGELRNAMLTRENMLEDVNYHKVVPNYFVVEISDQNYARLFHPIEGQILHQWRGRLMEELVTANSRQGRKEYHFGGRLRIEVRPAPDLREFEARILSRIESEGAAGMARVPNYGQAGSPVPSPGSRITPPPAARPHVIPPFKQDHPPATEPSPGSPQAGKTIPPEPDAPGSAAATFLELFPTGQRWALYPGTNTIGRSESCQVFLDLPVVQEKRLISGQHAYIVMNHEVCILYDGAPDGRPSANGTFVNRRRVPPAGYRLQNGDAIVLAALDPLHPRSDTPGVVTFYFWSNR